MSSSELLLINVSRYLLTLCESLNLKVLLRFVIVTYLGTYHCEMLTNCNKVKLQLVN